MPTISKDNPCYYITSVTTNRLPVFRTDKLKQLTCEAITEARQSGGFLIFAYVIMPDHFHIITDGSRKASDTLRFLNGITAHRVIKYLKENNFNTSLEKLRHETKERKYKHSLWQHHSNTFLITAESAFVQRVNYIHLNPVRAGMVERTEDYFYSSARIWRRIPLENEPLTVDVDKIVWREAEPRRK